MIIGKKEFPIGRKTYIMGILNVTKDSFFDGGRYHALDKALFHAEEMIREGADILDVGGESTRPGYTPVSEQEEMAAVLPVIEAVRSRFDIPISLDTYKSRVAAAGIEAGADMINDIWGLKHDAEMAEVIAKSGVACCLMHNRKMPAEAGFFQKVEEEMADSLRLAKQAGISFQKIVLDPGIGFGKTYEQNLQILGRLEELQKFGCPILLGCSNKSVVGLTLQLPPTERLEGTLATSVCGVLYGCSFLRVHQIRENVLAVRMAEAILQAKRDDMTIRG